LAEEGNYAPNVHRASCELGFPTHALLVQNGRIEFDSEITDPVKLANVLRPFFEYRQPHQEDWDRAVREFSGPPLTGRPGIYPRRLEAQVYTGF